MLRFFYFKYYGRTVIQYSFTEQEKVELKDQQYLQQEYLSKVRKNVLEHLKQRLYVLQICSTFECVFYSDSADDNFMDAKTKFNKMLEWLNTECINAVYVFSYREHEIIFPLCKLNEKEVQEQISELHKQLEEKTKEIGLDLVDIFKYSNFSSYLYFENKEDALKFKLTWF